jgi:4-hydroxy-tetrahydrodipicolinate synthase
MNTPTFTGVMTALVTPMREESICYEDLTKLIEFQIQEGINGLVSVGTTGESPTLSDDEHLAVIRHTVKVTAGRVPVIAGTGANSTTEAISLTREAHKIGVDGILLVAPYYNKPSQEGLFRHFSAVAQETDKPIILYSIPSRCGVEIGIDTVCRLAEKYTHVRTIKEAGGSCDRVSRLIESAGDTLTILSGDDNLTLPFMSLGATGVISVASNLVVTDLVKMVQAALNNDFATASKINNKYYKLFRDIFIETNPVPIKYTLQRAGYISSDQVRLPLCPMSDVNKDILIKTLEQIEKS